MIFWDRIPMGGADITHARLKASTDIHGGKNGSYELVVNGIIVGYGLTISEGVKLAREVDRRRSQKVVHRTFGKKGTVWEFREVKKEAPSLDSQA